MFAMPSSPTRFAKPRTITDLLSARLHALANLSAASTSLRVERKFGLTLLEWRALGQLGGFAPLSLKELARRAGLDKSYASRTVSGLIDRGLVLSARNDADARAVLLSLSDAGQQMYQAAFDDAVKRNDQLLAPLEPVQRQQFIEILSVLTQSARKALDNERRAAAGEWVEEAAAARTFPVGEGRAAAVDLSEVRYLVNRLTELIGPA